MVLMLMYVWVYLGAYVNCKREREHDVQRSADLSDLVGP
jgi:hypothetical protein